MAGKKRKKSSEDLINSAVDGLSSADPKTIFGPLITPHKPGSVYGEEGTMPKGLGSKSSVLRPREAPALFQEEEAELSQKPQELVGDSEKTMEIASVPEQSSSGEVNYSAKTIVVNKAKVQELDLSAAPIEEKISFGAPRTSQGAQISTNITPTDAQLQQAETLRMAQERLTELERENEKLRAENEDLSSASALAKEKIEELMGKLGELERERSAQSGQYQAEINIIKDKSVYKDVEINKLRQKVGDLETRLRQDLRKIRVRERELENRLELTKMEKETLLRAKDEAILDLKRKLEQLQHELDGYRHRVADLNNRVEDNHEQLSRTVRALRLALTNLEVSDATTGSSITIAPLKKAE